MHEAARVPPNQAKPGVMGWVGARPNRIVFKRELETFIHPHTYSPSHPLFIFLPLLVAVSGCRFASLNLRMLYY